MARRIRLNRTLAERLGRRAETLASLWLRAKGYQILATRFRCPQGEIDLIARRRGTLIFVEVKARRDRAAAIYATTAEGEARIAAAGEIWRARFAPQFQGPIRYDVITVVHGCPRHQKDAWRP